MISGHVNASLEGIVRLAVLDMAGQVHEIEAVVDTGFSGALTLPPARIAALGLPWRSRASVILANGDRDICDVYDATLVWDGQPLPILVEEAETEPLLGMGLIAGHELRLRAIRGGDLTIERIP